MNDMICLFISSFLGGMLGYVSGSYVVRNIYTHQTKRKAKTKHIKADIKSNERLQSSEIESGLAADINRSEIIDMSHLFQSEQKTKSHLIYGQPSISRIHPIDPDSTLYSNPDRCQLCCLTFDAAAELRITLEKDGYGDCSFCPKCGRKLS